jgi:hypothetical protein
MSYYKQNTFRSRLLYNTACAVQSFGRFLALPLRVIPERFQWTTYKNNPALNKPNWLADFFCPMWIINLYQYLFEESLRYDPESKVWDDPESVEYVYYQLLIEDI